jgi:GntR family transcriptional regulator
LPANELLAAEFGVSCVTIRQAVELLARDGIIQAQQGRGTFITGMPSRIAGLRSRRPCASFAEVYRDTSTEVINISESRTDATPARRGWKASGAVRASPTFA